MVVTNHLMFKSQAPLKRQLMIVFVVSVAVLSFATSFVTAWRASEEIKVSFLKDAIQVAKNFADESSFALVTATEENAKGAVQAAVGFNAVLAVAIFNLEGETISLSHDDKKDDFIFYESKVSSDTNLVSEQESFWIFSSPVFEAEADDGSFLDVEEEQGEINKEKKIIGYVFIEYDKSGLTNLQRTIFVNNFSAGAVATILILVFLGWGVNRLTQPLSDLSQIMAKTRDSKDYIKAEVNGAREIRQVATIYNEMMDQLESQNEELEKHRDSLESEVEIRTKDLKVARDNAMTANRHKSEFLANVSHELRTPLQAIIGNADLAREELELAFLDDLAADQNVIIKAAHNLLALINNILDLSKIEAGKMDLSLSDVDMYDLLDETMNMISPMAATNNNEVLLDSSGVESALRLDRQKMMQIFLNLLSNACKFTKSGKIKFAINNDDDYLYFSVADTGVGIPKEHLDVIFEEFTQVDGSLSRNFEGTGLGMAITNSFCDLMRGEISVESEMGVGTTFSVKLPLQQNQEANT